MLKASLFTLGCRLNQFETAYMAYVLEEMGYELLQFPEKADLYIINTCTVTAKSDAHSRQAARKAIRANPDALVIITGCAAQLDPEGFAAIQGVDCIIGNSEKPHFFSIASNIPKSIYPKIMVSDFREGLQPLVPMKINKYVDHTRAFIKVQEGCDAHCTYCIVPQVRGPARSIPVKEIVDQVDRLLSFGYKEIVLTGIHLGQYGKDMCPRLELHELLNKLLSPIGKNRVRLSSIEPHEISEGLLTHIESSSRLCPHFHVPLQSGSRDILMRMGRSYTPEAYKEVVQCLARKNPIASIGADVMVGFPGESEKDFQETFMLLENLPVSYLHVFCFSPRPGTPASLMPHQVTNNAKRERSIQLRRLSTKKKREFRSQFIGKELEALILNQTGPSPSHIIALTGNYIPVYIESGNDMMNQMAIVKIEKVTHEGVWGKVTSLLN